MVLGSVVNLNHPAHYIHWGWFQISVANFIVIALNGRRLRPRNTHPVPESPEPMSARGEHRMWTARLREASVRALPPERLIPDRQPAYVSSWIYVFGVLTIAALVVVLVSGGVLAIWGPSWWHSSRVGLFVNSLHLWSVELFMFFMVIHLWGKFFMAAWRGKRSMTWVTGVVAFVLSIGAAFTGYLSQQNFASQWIGSEAKDGLNSVGVGPYFNVLNLGQMLMWHILLLPLALGAFVVIHVLMVRRRGVVPPFPPKTPAGTPRPGTKPATTGNGPTP